MTAIDGVDFRWDNPHKTIRHGIVADNVVVASQPLAAEAGLQILASGGNAVDAAIAAASVLAVVEPTNNGLGGDAFAQVWHRGELHGINGSGRAPRRWIREHFAGRKTMPRRGWDSVTVPGAVALWCELSRRFGRLPLARSIERAIHYATDGFLVSPQVAEKWSQQAPALATEPGFADAFLQQGRAPRPGERFRLPGTAQTLERIATTNGLDFYEGETARRIVAFARETGGVIEADDLASHETTFNPPIAVDYDGLTAYEMPPNGQGLVAVMALRMLAELELADLDVDSAQAIHLEIEAIKLAFADTRCYLGDPDAMRVSVAQLVDQDFAKRARRIDPNRAQAFGSAVSIEAGTVYLATADCEGSVVSLIQSNYMGFGAGVVVPGTGVSLHNRGACFTLERGHPNEVGPAKRPLHTILPGIVMRNGSVVAAFGATGGNFQPQGHVQMIARLARGENPQAIVDAPRFRVDDGFKVSFEPGFDPGVVAKLAALGHEVNAQTEASWDFGAMQMIVRARDGWLGASDSRRDSQAVGF